MDLSRRRFLGLGDAGDRRALVVVFLRGGADGLSLVAPYGDDRYRALRPTLAIPPPRGGRAAAGDRAVDLDGFFGLHPRLAPLATAFRDGALDVIHAVGSDDETRSHFEAQDRMEQAGPAGTSTASGWIARHLASRPGPAAGPLAAVAFGARLPEALRGAAGATAALSLESLKLGDGRSRAEADALVDLYRTGGDGLARKLADAGRSTLDVLARLESIDRPGGRAAYPEHPFGKALADVAALVRAGVGLEVASVDLGNWDHHFVEGRLLPDLADVLGRGLAALREDLGGDRGKVDVVVMSEFGRRAGENGSLGTDHGRGGVMFALGEGLGDGTVRGRWPGLAEGDLVGPGDLAVTTDYRAVLAEILRARFANPRAADAVFPGP